MSLLPLDTVLTGEAKLLPPLHPGQVILSKLGADDRMRTAWESLRPFQNKPSVNNVILDVLRCALTAKTESDSRAIRSSLSDDAATRIDAAKRLLTYVQDIAISDVGIDAAPSAVSFNASARAARESLAWLVATMPDLDQAGQALVDQHFPLSQKRDDPKHAFEVMLSGRMASRLGAPLSSFVATASSILFDADDVDPNSVRRAWSREKVRRESKQDD